MKVGDIAIVQNASKPERNGLEVEIIIGWQMKYFVSKGVEVEVCIVLAPDGREFHAMRHQLKPLSDGNQPSGWENCIWQPSEINIEVKP